MAWPMQPSHRSGDGIPVVVGYTVKTSETFYIGAPVTYSSGLEELDASDVTGIIGVALAGAATASTPDWPADTSATVPVALADDGQIFSAQVVASAAILTDLSSLTIGGRYGVVKLTNHWYVDQDASYATIEVIDKDDNLNIAFFKFIASARVDA